MVTTIQTTALPISELDFPAVTICNQGFNVKTMYKFHKLMPEKWEPWFSRHVQKSPDNPTMLITQSSYSNKVLPKMCIWSHNCLHIHTIIITPLYAKISKGKNGN